MSKDRLSDLEDLIGEDKIFSFDSLPDDICDHLNDAYMENGYLHDDKKF